MADNDRKPKLTDNPKKTILGRKWEKAKVQKLSSHVIGLPCNCKRLRCFEVTTDIERNALIAHFNSLKRKDQQDSMIASLISIKTIKQRRPRQSEDITMPTHRSTALKLKRMELLLLFLSAFLHFYQCLVSPSPEL